MNGIERESTMGQVVVAVNAFVQLFMFFPKICQKGGELFAYIFSNFKQFAIFMFCAIGVVVCTLLVMYYTENNYNLKARLANVLVPPTSVKSTSVKEF
jgi:hypothetical protein